jgi:hypothetical protein
MSPTIKATGSPAQIEIIRNLGIMIFYEEDFIKFEEKL